MNSDLPDPATPVTTTRRMWRSNVSAVWTKSSGGGQVKAIFSPVNGWMNDKCHACSI